LSYPTLLGEGGRGKRHESIIIIIFTDQSAAL
jgi:hypothetical protein